MTTRQIIRPVHPGEILAEDFLPDYGLTPTALAKELHIPRDRLEKIIRCQRAVTADTALRLGRYFGTSAKFWLNLQSQYDLDLASVRFAGEVASIIPRDVAA